MNNKETNTIQVIQSSPTQEHVRHHLDCSAVAMKEGILESAWIHVHAQPERRKDFIRILPCCLDKSKNKPLLIGARSQTY